MKTFLEYVADDILLKYGDDLSRIVVVFPNKRASLFLNRHLAARSSRPIWSPSYMTISDLFRQHSQRVVADPIKQVCDLYKSFVAQTGSDETLDHFYGWGQLLLTDFDDIDKNMADADRVFANVSDLHELDAADYLTDSQREALQRFFSNFTADHSTLLKERFLKLWSRMGAVYHDFNERLATQGLAYEGALYREVAEHSQQLTADSQQPTFLFVGFNMVQPVEQCLFRALCQQGKARFYWDFDQWYMHDNEAGHYIARCLAHFPNELDISRHDIYDNFQKPKTISYVSATTENAQARYVSSWLRDNQRAEAACHTAIILCDESLLPTVIHCLPDEVQKVNITTGYPLSQSPVASLISQLTDLRILGYDQQRKTFRRRYLDATLRHPYLTQLPADEALAMLTASEPLLPWIATILQRIAVGERREDCSRKEEGGRRKEDCSRKEEGEERGDPLFQECVFRAYTLINRLQALVESGDLTVTDVTMQRLIRQLIQTMSVPFHGEPVEGIQVMGVLETRNLDFDHVVLLSCNEGNMPRGVNDASFIPYSIRKAYGLTTIDHKVAIYSYYFHRLLQRASDVTILYNNSTTDGQTGEMSRFMLQMMVEDRHHHIDFQTIQVPATIHRATIPAIPRTSLLLPPSSFLLPPSSNNPPSSFLEQSPFLLSPTAINTWLRCQLQYYYKYVCQLKEPEADNEETIDNRTFGDVFHDAAQIIYGRLMAKSHQILKSDIEAMLHTQVDIERAVDEAMHKHNITPQNGLQLISREVIIHYLRQLLSIDKRQAPFSIISLEGDVYGTASHIRIGGRIDRLDRVVKDGMECIRVIDYKTGSYQPRPLPNVEAIFQPENVANHSDYYLQTFLYAALVSQSYPQIAVSPALLFIQHAGGDAFDPTLCFGKVPIDDVRPFIPQFMQLLSQTVDQMFNPDIPYQPTAFRERCLTCPYRLLCQI